MTRVEAFEAQGARCGYIDGRSRNGIYVIGEEYMVDLNPHGGTSTERAAFAQGYAAGYRVGADGSELDAETINAPLPEEC